MQQRRFTAAAVYLRAFCTVSVCQLLRCASFLSTQLPGPADHCQPGAPTAVLPSSGAAGDGALLSAADLARAFFAVNVRRQVRTRGGAAPGAVWCIISRTWHNLANTTPPATSQVNRSCGDLIFSSHVTFALAFALTFRRYGPAGPWGAVAKAAAFAAVAEFSLLVVASRKHYSVDVVAAWCAAQPVRSKPGRFPR